ncbi:phosphotransferase family protein [Nioella nitratireducens]|uniref:phosphotransferase family protein n=1 Tax=Nioella nitratireducens TaxID=1287720 RepID=UPI0008FD5D9D|nr:phosphotransferase family protein [Nioella nitratireducens]
MEEAELRPLGRYLEGAVEGFKGLRTAQKFTDGQSNPTFKLRAESGTYVLRRKPPGELLKSAHAVDREFRVLAALAQTDVPVARALHLCADENVLGSMFYVMEFVEGRVFWDPALPGLAPAERAEIYDQMNAVLAAIHSVDLEAVGLADFGRPGGYYDRQYATWVRQYRATETEAIPEMERIIDWLGANMVTDDGRVSLVHGDYRLDNVMFAPDAPRLIAVMDWELSTLGHPLADLAYQCMLWRMPPGPVLSGLEGLDRRALGLPTEEAYVARYCERMGLPGIENWPFYLVFGLFRLAAIVQGVKYRGLQGNASSDRALQVGALAAPLARKACDILDETG